MADISIIIVAWNAQKQLKDCLASVRRQRFSSYEVIVVDNGSVDGTTDMMQKDFSEYTYIRLSENYGFCKGNNYGLSHAQGRYVFLLNSDVVLKDTFLAEVMKDPTLQDPSFGMWQPKVLRKDQMTIDTTGLVLSKALRFFDRGSGEKDYGHYDHDLSGFFGVCGCAAIYRKDALDAIGENKHYFDEQFFFLGEDFDVAWRLKKKGYDAQYIPSAVCFHERGSSRHNMLFKQYLSWRNRWILIRKHYGIGQYVKKKGVYLVTYDIPRFFMLCMFNAYVRRFFCIDFYRYLRNNTISNLRKNRR